MLKSFPYRAPALMLTLAATLWVTPVQAAVSFMPVSGWTVGSTELASVRGLKDVKLPCVISAEYDNGFVVRFSGGGGQMLALAIDFRQSVFNQGQKYSAMLSVGDGYVKQVSASAFTPSMLIFNLREISDFYTTLKAAQKFALDVDGNAFEFSLQQFANNLGGLESCYATGNASPIQPISAPQSQPTPITEMPAQQGLPQSFDDIIKAPPEHAPERNPGMTTASALTPLPGETRPDSIVSQGRVSRVTPSDAKWTARAGEDMRTVLTRWSTAAGYDLQWQASDNGKVVQDVSVNGRFEDAVSQLLAENRVASGIKGRFDDGSSTPRSTTFASSLPSSSWTASPGADLKSVLNSWAQREGVQVVWRTSEGMPPVKMPVQQSGSFESAVSALLDQYTEDSRRPVAQLNIDPRTQKRTLTLDIDQAS